MLLSSDDASDDGHGNITIKVTGAQKASAATQPDDSHPGPAPQLHVHVIPHGETNGSDPAAPSSRDSRSFMEMGLAHYMSGDFDQAIAAYRHALASAGDDTAYVYQRIAICYQKRGDKESALTNFQNAINNYRALINAGRHVEEAKAGLRVCESAIKTCSL